MQEFNDKVFALKKKLGQELNDLFTQYQCVDYNIVNPVSLSYFEKLDSRSCLSMELCDRFTGKPSENPEPENAYYAVFVDKYDEDVPGKYDSSVVDFQIESLMTLLKHLNNWLPTYQIKVDLFKKILEHGGSEPIRKEYDMMGYKFQLKSVAATGKLEAMGEMTLTVGTNHFGEKKINLWNVRDEKLLAALVEALD